MEMTFQRSLFRIGRDVPRRPREAKGLRSAGDSARDVRDWPAAAKAYEAYLAAVPDDAAIWVQYGHALKEAGSLRNAADAYHKAVSLAANDTDAALHLKDVLQRLEGETSLGNFAVRPPSAIRGGIYLELKDLFQYLSLHTTITGITRVTLSLVNYILEELDEKRATNYQFVHQIGDAEGLIFISKDRMRRIVRAAMHEVPDITAMQELIRVIRTSSPAFKLEKGDTYLIVGAFWEFVANPSWIGGMRHRGVFIGAYIYDLIPITHAQYCMAALTDAFTVAFAETARLLDFALTISEFVAHQVTTYLAAHHIQPFPTLPVPLAHVLRFEDKAGRREPVRHADQTASAEKREYFGGFPFVLCVCTIEARKNHIYLFLIWQRMIKAGIKVPELVFVGRPGWRVEDLMEQIETSRHLNGQLHILNGISDEELAGLYERCLFTVFPSFVEGWGLPVGESLAHGKVCVASSATSIPEVGGEYVVYIDPFDIESGYAVISRLIRNPAEVAEMEARLRNSFTARTWNDVGRDFFAKVEGVRADLQRAQSPRALFAPSLRPTEIFDVATLNKVERWSEAYIANPARLVFAEGWRGVEASGTWMLDAEAKMRVMTECAPHEEVSVLLHVGTSPWVAAHNTLHISAFGPAAEAGTSDQSSYHRPMRPNEEFWLTLRGRLDENASLNVYFHVSGPIKAERPNVPVAMRLKGFGYAPLNEMSSRLSLLENALLR